MCFVLFGQKIQFRESSDTAIAISQLSKMSIKTPTVKFTTTQDEIPVVGMVRPILSGEA